MKKIVLRNGLFRKLHVIRLEFPYDFELKETVKTFPDCQWDRKGKVWWVPYSDNRLSELLEFF